MALDALERLFNNNNGSDAEYSLEEQMASADILDDEDDFLNNMSMESKEALSRKINEESSDINNTDDEEEFGFIGPDMQPINPSPILAHVEAATESPNVNIEEDVKVQPKRGRKRRNTNVNNEPPSNNTTFTNNSNINDMFIPIMDQLAKDLIDNLRQSDYKIARFNSEQMQIVYNYMYNKF